MILRDRIYSIIVEHKGKPCPSNSYLVGVTGAKYNSVSASIEKLIQDGKLERLKAKNRARKFIFEGGTTDWTVRTTAAQVVRSFDMSNAVFAPTQTCWRCGASSLHGCEHMRMAA